MTLLLDAPNGGALLGEQTPRIHSAPSYVASSGPEVRELAQRAGLVLDPWEALVLDEALGERADGDWAAFEVGLVVPRQNGKGSIVEARELGGLFLLNEPLILHTAHEVKTAGEAFLRIYGLIADNEEFSGRVKRWNRSHGEEGIELRPTPTIILGAGGRQIRRSVAPRLRFLARSRVGGRGFTGRVVILDEAFELTEAAMAALLPTMSAQPNPQLWYTSTAPDQMKDHNARVLARVRARGRAGTASRLEYMEWSAGDRDDLSPDDLAKLRSDRQAWARANPALGIRISEEFISSELGALDDRSFEVERLGIGDWPAVDDSEAWAVIPKAAWDALADNDSELEDPVAFAIAVHPEERGASIAVAGRRGDGNLFVELVEYRPGTSWVSQRMAELDRQWDPCAIVVDVGGPAGSLIPELRNAALRIVEPKVREVADASEQAYDAVTDSKTWRHLGDVVSQRPLRKALAAAQKRPLRDKWTWDRRVSVDQSPLEAVTLAAWGWGVYGQELGPDDITIAAI